MFWRKKTPPPQIEWEENPGCFERHLQRRYNNSLFPTDRQKVSTEELKHARAKDKISQKEFLKQYALHVSEVTRLEGNMPISDCSKCLQDTQFLLELSASTGTDLENETAVLETVENSLMAAMNASLPQGEELLEKGHALSMLARTHPADLAWGLAKIGEKPGMQITARLQATNTSKYGIRPSGAKLQDPKGIDIIHHMLLVENPDSGMYGSTDLIPPQSIGRVALHFIVTPVTTTPGQSLHARVLILDQFANEHPVDLECKFIGPETI